SPACGGGRIASKDAMRVGETLSTRTAGLVETPPPRPSPASGRGSAAPAWLETTSTRESLLCARERLMRSMGRRGSQRLRIRRFAEKALITFPFHDPTPGRAVTVAGELGIETWRTPNAAWCLRRRMRRAHDPSCFRGGGQRLRCNPQQQSGDAGGLRGQGQLAARDKVELLGLPPDFQHHRAQRITGERIRRRAQRALDI